LGLGEEAAGLNTHRPATVPLDRHLPAPPPAATTSMRRRRRSPCHRTMRRRRRSPLPSCPRSPPS
jgi:hypothetical protein